MKNFSWILLFCAVLAQSAGAELLDHRELETGRLLPGYTTIIDSPFTGVAAYGNGDGVELPTQISNVPGVFRVDVRGASSDSSTAKIAVYLGGTKIGQLGFTGTSSSVQSQEFSLQEPPNTSNLKFVLESDTGANDTYLDWYELHRVGNIPPPPPPPVLPSQGSYDSGVYRNLFKEMGISQADVDARIQDVYDQLFHSSDKQNEAIFIPVGSDMAYIWDAGNNDVRSEGMSYGMMMAVQMDRKNDFDRLWKWAHTHMLNTTGDMQGYFAWQVSTSGNIMDKNPAPDGEEYFVTALFFASHLWGDGNGIFDYSAQANQILDNMYNNGQTRYNNQGELENFSLFDHDQKQVVFSPAISSDSNYTDPSYHLPAFYELWARWADNHNNFWADLAVSSRAFFKTTADSQTGLSPDYAHFDGSADPNLRTGKDAFQYDAWRTISNASLDYAWWQKDSWEVEWATRLQGFFESEGVDSYSSLYELNGVPYQNNADHSPGLVAMNAVASLATEDPRAWKFVQALWDLDTPTGKWRYYDGSLYMLGMLAVSGKYHIICPDGGCDYVEPPTCEQTGTCPVNSAPVAQDDTAQTAAQVAVDVNVLQNDTDADGDSLNIASFTQPGNGSVERSGSQLRYTPSNAFVGTDSFSYTLSDGNDTDTANVTVTVTEASGDGGGDGDNGGGSGSGGDSQLLGTYEFESGSISPSYRGPISSPYSGVKLYGNGDSDSFNVDLPAGSYVIRVSGSSSNSTAAGVSLYVDGSKKGSTSFSSTTRETKEISFDLASAATEVKFVLETDVGQNDTLLDWFKIYSGSADAGNDNGGTSGDTATEVTVEAEDYTAFYDTISGNTGGAYRSDDVDIETAIDSSGDYNVGWIDSGEWLEYTVTLEEGTYTVQSRVASDQSSGQFNILLDGSSLVSNQQVDSTGGWQNWQTITSSSVFIPAGTYTLRVAMTGSYFNLNWIKFVPQ